MRTLYDNWAKSCYVSGLFLLVVLFSSFQALGLINVLIWLQVVVYLWHQGEEHSYPGGFKDYINQHVFNSQVPNMPLDQAGVFWINISLIWLLFPVAAVIAQNWNVSFGVFLPVFGLFNATTHMLLAIKKRAYNPGLVVSVCLNYPTGLYTLHVFHQAGILTNVTGWWAFAASFVLHIMMVGYAVCRLKGCFPFTACKK